MCFLTENSRYQKKKKKRGALSAKHATPSRICESEPHTGCRDYLNKLKEKRKNEKWHGLFGKLRKYPAGMTDLEKVEAVLASFTCSSEQGPDTLMMVKPRKTGDSDQTCSLRS